MFLVVEIVLPTFFVVPFTLTVFVLHFWFAYISLFFLSPRLSSHFFHHNFSYFINLIKNLTLPCRAEIVHHIFSMFFVFFLVIFNIFPPSLFFLAFIRFFRTLWNIILHILTKPYRCERWNLVIVLKSQLFNRCPPMASLLFSTASADYRKVFIG